jgi:flavin reductase (DIM6/NTAB) family NADH-FMN oxidoreductase RutF
MNLKPYDWRSLGENVFSLIADGWMLITAGEGKAWNTMTASWGGLGELWNRDVAFVFVRPTRYTYGFMEGSELFSLSFFGEEGRAALSVCGSTSGRDTDKAAAAGLSPAVLQLPTGGARGGASGDVSGDVSVVGFEEARLVIACRKVYAADIEEAKFVDRELLKNYPKKDYHRMYVGAIEAAWSK